MELYLKKLKKAAIVVAIFLSLLTCETAANNCSKGVSWKDTTYYRKLRIQGEWMKINCAIRTSENVTLWFGKSKGETTKKLEVDNKKIKLISKNVFNITNLTTENHGWYTCQVCGKKLAKFLEVPDHGKAYARPIVEKKPNEDLYEIEGSVKLTCHAEGITVAVYDIIWYKLSPDGKFKKLASKGSHVNGMWTETLSLSRLSERDDGTYKCQINRYPLQYRANELVNISVKDPLKPKFRINNEQVDFQPEQGKDFLLSYNVSSNPASHIKWWRSKDEIHYELIAECPPSEGCKKHLGEQNISKTSFEIKDLKFPQDEFFYKCNASNKYGNDSKTFQLEVYVKPTIFLHRIHFYEKDKIINCTLTKGGINPQQVNFTWYLCGSSECDTTNLNKISNSYSLRLKSQSNNRLNFRCEAKNAAGSAHQDIVVVIVSSYDESNSSQQKAILVSILAPIMIIAMIIY